MAPIIDRMKGNRLEWTDDAELAFRLIKERFTMAPILVLPDFSQPFKLHIDACKVSINAVLSQNNKLVAFFSEKLSRAKCNYSTYDVEFYVIVQLVRYCHHYLFHWEFILYTNHDSLRHLH